MLNSIKKSGNQPKPTVFIIDDDEEFCFSLQWLLESVGVAVSVFNNANTFLNDFSAACVGCILLDIRMPLMSGLELQAQLNSQHNTLPIIFMTGHADIPMAVRAMKAGAFDFLTKPFNEQVALERIQQAIVKHQQIMADSNQLQTEHGRFKSLTKRQREVLDLIAEGKLNKEIAYELNVSVKTVELHRTNIMHKLQVGTVAGLIKTYLLLKKQISFKKAI